MGEFTAIVPARAGSKGLPGKNVRPMAGVPLWRRAVEQALDAGAARVVVTTDCREILVAGVPERVVLLERPGELAGDNVPMAPVLLHAIGAAQLSGTVCLLQCTSPLRTIEDIAAGLSRYETGDVDLVMSVTEADPGVLKYGTIEDGVFRALRDPSHPFSNRQDLPPVFRPNGAIYVFETDWFVANAGFTTEKIGTLTMPTARSLDIDTEDDFIRVEAALTAY